MRALQIFVAAFVFLLLQMFLVPQISIGEISPDFPLLLVVYIAVNRGPIPGSIAGFIIGLVQDLFNPELIGLNALTKSLAGYTTSVLVSIADAENILFLATLFGIVAIAHDFLYLLIYTGLNVGTFLTLWVTVSLPSALYTAFAGVLVYKLASVFGGKVVKSLGKARP